MNDPKKAKDLQEWLDMLKQDYLDKRYQDALDYEREQIFGLEDVSEEESDNE